MKGNFFHFEIEGIFHANIMNVGSRKTSQSILFVVFIWTYVK